MDYKKLSVELDDTFLGTANTSFTGMLWEVIDTVEQQRDFKLSYRRMALKERLCKPDHYRAVYVGHPGRLVVNARPGCMRIHFKEHQADGSHLTAEFWDYDQCLVFTQENEGSGYTVWFDAVDIDEKGAGISQDHPFHHIRQFHDEIWDAIHAAELSTPDAHEVEDSFCTPEEIAKRDDDSQE